MGAGARVDAGWDLRLSAGGGPGMDEQHQSVSDSHHKNKKNNLKKPLRLLSVLSPACAQVSALRAALDTPAQLGELV